MFCLKFAEFRPSRCPNGCQRRGGHPGGRVCQQNRNYDQREAHRRMPRRPHPLGARWPVDARGRAAVMTPIIAMTPRAPRRELPTKDQRSGGAVTCYNVNLGFREFQISVHQNLNPAEGRSQSNPDIPRDRRGGAFRYRSHWVRARQRCALVYSARAPPHRDALTRSRRPPRSRRRRRMLACFVRRAHAHLTGVPADRLPGALLPPCLRQQDRPPP
jgi:hypothetical protein